MNNGELAPRAQWSEMARKYRDTYAKVPRTGFIQKTFGLWMCLDAWRADGRSVSTLLGGPFAGDEVEMGWPAPLVPQKDERSARAAWADRSWGGACRRWRRKRLGLALLGGLARLGGRRTPGEGALVFRFASRWNAGGGDGIDAHRGCWRRGRCFGWLSGRRHGRRA